MTDILNMPTLDQLIAFRGILIAERNRTLRTTFEVDRRITRKTIGRAQISGQRLRLSKIKLTRLIEQFSTNRNQRDQRQPALVSMAHLSSTSARFRSLGDPVNQNKNCFAGAFEFFCGRPVFRTVLERNDLIFSHATLHHVQRGPPSVCSIQGWMSARLSAPMKESPVGATPGLFLPRVCTARCVVPPPPQKN